MIDSRLKTGALLAVVALLGFGASAARAVDRNAASTRACEAAINHDIERVFPKATNIAWDMRSVDVQGMSHGLRLAGDGTYTDSSGKEQSFRFECEYDEDDGVTSAWWQSSSGSQRHTVEGSSDSTGITPSEITKACRSALESRIREDFDHSIRQIELIRDSLDRSEHEGSHELEGQGRFEGGGGNWHRFEFTCTYDDGDEEVTNVTWKHLGDERDLDG